MSARALASVIGAASVIVGLSACDDCRNVVTCEGDYEIHNAGNLQSARSCESITGSLDCSPFWPSKNITEFDLPCLTAVGQDLEIAHNVFLTSISLPGLTVVDGSLTFGSNEPLTHVDMPGLAVVEGNLHVLSNDAMTHLDMTSLSRVGADLVVGGNALLATLDGLGSLTSVGGDVNIDYNGCLSQDEAEAFAASLDVGGVVSLERNGEGLPCP